MSGRAAEDAAPSAFAALRHLPRSFIRGALRVVSRGRARVVANVALPRAQRAIAHQRVVRGEMPKRIGGRGGREPRAAVHPTAQRRKIPAHGLQRLRRPRPTNAATAITETAPGAGIGGPKYRLSIVTPPEQTIVSKASVLTMPLKGERPMD